MYISIAHSKARRNKTRNLCETNNRAKPEIRQETLSKKQETLDVQFSMPSAGKGGEVVWRLGFQSTCSPFTTIIDNIYC